MDNNNDQINNQNQQNDDQELKQEKIETVLGNDGENNDKDLLLISESIVNIEINQQSTSYNNEKNLTDRDVITESTVDITSSDDTVETKQEASTAVERNPITESTVVINSSDDTVETKKETLTAVERNPITESTVVISSYQPNDDENNSSYIELETPLTNKPESNTNSMILANALSSSESSSSSLPSPVDKEFTPLSDQEHKEQAQAVSNDNDDVENLVNSYEIPNFSNNHETQPTMTETKEEIKKPKRNLEEETYLKILGNDSLMKKITQYGVQDDEENARPRNGQMVTISYDAFLKDNNKLVDHNDNLSFILGDGDVISGLDMVVSLMNRNEKCEMITDARHAYGSRGREPDIPPEASLVYHVHLKDVKDVTLINEMSPIERLSMAEAKKLRGNYHFNRQDFYLAITSYKKGLKYFDEENLRGNEEQVDLTKFKELTQSLLMNLALSSFKMESHREALESLDQLLEMHNKHIKALYIKGKVLLMMGETQQAITTLNRAIELDPNNVEVKKELSKAQAKHKIQYQNEKDLYKKMMTGVVNEVKPVEKDKSKIANKNKPKNDYSYTSFITAGLALALVSVGIALFAKYKN